MEFKYDNSNGKVVLEIQLNSITNKKFAKCWKLQTKWSPIFFFSKRYFFCPQNKIIHNFLIISLNWINQRFTWRQNYIKKFKNLNFIFWLFAKKVSPSMWKFGLFVYNFCCKAPIQIKIISRQRQSVFLSYACESFKKFH